MEYFVDMDIFLCSNVDDFIDVDISLRFEEYLDGSKAMLLLQIHFVIYVSCLRLLCLLSIVITCCEKTDVLALLCYVLPCASNAMR